MPGGICLNVRTVTPVALFVAGVVCIAVAVASGEAEVSLFLIFPIFSGSSGLFLIGILLIILSFVVGFASLMMGQLELAGAVLGPDRQARSGDENRGAARYGGVVLLGPVPIAFGSDKTMALAMLVVGIVVAIVALLLIAFLLG